MHDVDEVEVASDNAGYNEKSGVVSSTVVTSKGGADIDNNHVVIFMETVQNNMKVWNTIYKVINED